MSRKNKLKKARRKAINWGITFNNKRFKHVEAMCNGANCETLDLLHKDIDTASNQELKARLRYCLYKDRHRSTGLEMYRQYVEKEL